MSRALCLAVAVLFLAGAKPAPPYVALVAPVLKLRCDNLAAAKFDKVGPELQSVVDDGTGAGDEALAILVGYDIGEEPRMKVSASILERGGRMLPLLAKYRDSKPPLAHPCAGTVLPPEERKTAYDTLAGMIKPGDRNQ